MDLQLTADQLDSLGSPVRINPYEAVRMRGQASVAELAVDLQKSVHSLYYHLKTLTDVGLVRVGEYRRVGKRDEAVYEAVSKRLVINRESTNPAYVESLIKTVRLALRKAEREHREARQDETPGHQFAILRLQARLSPDDAETLRKKVAELGQWVRKRDTARQDAKPVALTCLVVPTNPRN